MQTKDIADIGTETASYKVLPLGNMFMVWTVYASLSVSSPNPSDPIVFYFLRKWNAQIRQDYCTVGILLGLRDELFKGNRRICIDRALVSTVMNLRTP
jgi:hypothetical protein